MYSYTVFLQLLSSLVNLAPKVHAMQDYSKIDRIVTLGEGLAPEISIYFVYDFLWFFYDVHLWFFLYDFSIFLGNFDEK